MAFAFIVFYQTTLTVDLLLVCVTWVLQLFLYNALSTCQAAKLQKIQNGGQHGDSSSSLERKMDSFTVACTSEKTGRKRQKRSR